MYNDVTRRGREGRRHRIHSKRVDRRVFSKTADGTHKANFPGSRPMRGGIRL